ncbi:hypothetical protein EG329_010876 [Mollisiaceae sp. DMI_Dod_QoI]|nr:hypothetical protein EG329_010876 [Helotiales sp. DMI_Dod_QoI]
MNSVIWEPQPYVPTFEDMAHPYVEDVGRTFATAEKSPMARKDSPAAFFRGMIDQYCSIAAAARKKYMHTTGLEKQYNCYRWKNHFRNACAGQYSIDKKYWDIDQRELPIEKRCDMDFEERECWDWLVKESRHLDSAIREQLTIDDIDKQRKALDKMGIPNYVVRWYKSDWQTIEGLRLMVFPTNGREGPFTIEKSDGETSDGLLAEVHCWLEFVKHSDARYQRQMLIDIGYFQVANSPITYKVRVPRSGFFKASNVLQAPPNIEDMDMADSVADPSIASKRSIRPVQSKAILPSQSNVETTDSYAGKMQLPQSIEEEDDLDYETDYETDEDPDAADLMETTRLLLQTASLAEVETPLDGVPQVGAESEPHVQREPQSDMQIPSEAEAQVDREPENEFGNQLDFLEQFYGEVQFGGEQLADREPELQLDWVSKEVNME